MSFVKKRRPDNGGTLRLPKQAAPPTFKQLQAMLQACTQSTGRTCLITFGESPAQFTLAVLSSRHKGQVHWALYSGDGIGTMMLWDEHTNNAGFIHQLISAQFPGMDLKSVALRVTEPAAPPQIETSGPGPTGVNLHEQQSSTLRMRGKPTLEGDLQNLQMPALTRSIAMSLGTGRLEIENNNELATIFFADGEPIHCLSRGLEGESSFIELVSWEEGDFRFYPSQKNDKRTIYRSLDSMLLEGAAVQDQLEALRNMKGEDDACVTRCHKELTEQEFESILSKGIGCDLKLSKHIYLKADGRTRLIDLARRSNLAKRHWVPIIFNLATCQLIEFSKSLPAASNQNESLTKIDWSLASTAETLLTRADTGLYTYSTFLSFLKTELFRWERFGRPFSIIELELTCQSKDLRGQAEPLPLAAINEVARRVDAIKRKTDIFAHYETFGFALLLLETDGQAANAFTARLVEEISKERLSGEVSGLIVNVKAGVACIPDDCSTLGAMLAIGRPRSMAEALAEARERVKSVIDNALDVICSTDEQLRLVEINPACESALGYQPSEMLGVKLQSLLAPEDVETSLQKINELIGGAQDSSHMYLENRLMTRDGVKIDFQWSMRWSRENKLLFCVGRDISAQKELEALKKELITIVTHDLRSPAMAIDGFLEAIEGEFATPEGQHWQSMHKAAQSASNRMIKLISDLLSFERVNHSAVELVYKKVRLSEIFQTSVASVALPSSTVKIEVTATNLSLRCDQERVVQIIVNLLANAVKFSRPGTSVKLGAQETEQSIEIYVTDQGPGIAAENLESIFLPFKQTHGVDHNQSKGGFGLGLFIARSLAELHKGTLTIKSTLGEGSSFTLSLPQDPYNGQAE